MVMAGTLIGNSLATPAPEFEGLCLRFRGLTRYSWGSVKASGGGRLCRRFSDSPVRA